MSRPVIDYPRVVFSETQRFRQWWVWVLQVILTILPLVLLFLLFRASGGNLRRVPPVLWVVFGLVAPLPLLFLLMRMNLTVRSDQIIIGYFPFRRRIALSQIAGFEVIPYHWMDFGGWGVKWDMDKTWSYTVSGDRAVRLVLHDRGKRIVIGTQRADDLAAALEQLGVPRTGALTPPA